MILVCSASHGKNLELAQLTVERARAQGMDAAVIDLTELELPLYTSRSNESPPAVHHLAERFADADAFFVFTAEYNGSIPPAFTNTIAWLSTETDDFRALFNGKVAAIGTHSGGSGQKVLVAVRMQLSHLGTHVIGREILTNKDKPIRTQSIDSVLTEIKRITPAFSLSMDGSTR